MTFSNMNSKTVRQNTRHVLILFAHPALQKSRVNRVLVRAIEGLDGVTGGSVVQLKTLIQTGFPVIVETWYVRDAHDQLQKDYNQAVEDAANEEKIASFSLGADYPTIREFVGEVTSKDVDIAVTMKDGTTSNYKVKLRHYLLEDESANLTHRGRWIIVRFESL